MGERVMKQDPSVAPRRGATAPLAGEPKRKGFDLGDVLASVLPVSESDTKEQLVYLDISLIDADEANFYSLDGIDELAANLELIGLQQPLRVRENPGMPGRYLIVSGHRRRAALWTLYEEDPEKWGNVPCIIERSADSAALQELRLIYANSDTRRMSSADLSKQAERVEALLYQLQTEGYNFPGRMRDHVAAACQTSATKLATLKVIREKLDPLLLKSWESGKISDTCAYLVAKESPEIQGWLLRFVGADKVVDAAAWKITDWINDIRNITEMTCDGEPCRAAEQRLRYWGSETWTACPRSCCKTCMNLRTCKHSCALAAEQKAARQAEYDREQADREERIARQTAAREAYQAQALAERNRQAEKNAKEWSRLGRLAERALVAPAEVAAVIMGCDPEEVNEDQMRELSIFFGDEPMEDGSDYGSPWEDGVEVLSDMADLLGCTTDELLGRAIPIGRGDDSPQFRAGHPDRDTLCWCVFEQPGGKPMTIAARWKADEGQWWFVNINASIDSPCAGWFPLPDYEGVLRK